MVTRGRETQDMGNTELTLLPPPERCVPHRTPSNGEGGWALWRPQGTRRQDRTGGLQGGARSGTHGGAGSSGYNGGSGSSGGHGGSGDSGGHGGTAAAPPTPVSSAGALLPPKKNFLGVNRGSIGHLGALWRRRHLGALWRRRHS